MCRYMEKKEMLEEMCPKNNRNQADWEWPNDANVKSEALQSEAHAFQLYVAKHRLNMHIYIHSYLQCAYLLTLRHVKPDFARYDGGSIVAKTFSGWG